MIDDNGGRIIEVRSGITPAAPFNQINSLWQNS